jgi:hypothetical protein
MINAGCDLAIRAGLPDGMCCGETSVAEILRASVSKHKAFWTEILYKLNQRLTGLFCLSGWKRKNRGGADQLLS